MTRATSNSRKAAKAARTAIKASKKAALDDICRDLYQSSVENNGRVPHGYVADVVKALKPTWPWLTRDVINAYLLKYKKIMEERKIIGKDSEDQSFLGVDIIPSSHTHISDVSGFSSIESVNNGEITVAIASLEDSVSKKSKGGRPVGTTNSKKHLQEKLLFEAKNEIALAYVKEKRQAKKKGSIVKKGYMKELIASVTAQKDLKRKILSKTIHQRIARKQFVHHHKAGHISPLRKIEPAIVKIIIQMARIRQSLTPSKALSLVNSIIDEKQIQQDLIKWKEKYSNNMDGTVGQGYWNRFMKRQKHRIVSKRGQKYELNRAKWTTYDNFQICIRIHTMRCTMLVCVMN